jgi:predicted Zn-ribbon and HTH transcriptional regulator
MDKVKCNWCGWIGEVVKGAEACPCCKEEGFLQWQDDEDQESIIQSVPGTPGILGKGEKQ